MHQARTTAPRSGNSNNHRHDNNNSSSNTTTRYTSGLMSAADNGIHFFPIRRDTLSLENMATRAPPPPPPTAAPPPPPQTARTRSKWTAMSDIVVTQRVLSWATANTRDAAFWSTTTTNGKDVMQQQRQYHQQQRQHHQFHDNAERQPFLTPKTATSRDINQKKARQLLPFVHHPQSPQKSQQNRIENRFSKSTKTLSINNNNNNNFTLDDLQATILIRPATMLTPSSPMNDFDSADKSPDANNFPADQHYEHYYSYYYNRQANFKTDRKVRKLPDTTAMAAAKKNAEAAEQQLTQRQLDTASHILKEKINNNNILICDDDDNNWQLMHDGAIGDVGGCNVNKQLRTATTTLTNGDFVDVNNFNASKSKNFSEALDKVEAVRHLDIDEEQHGEPKVHQSKNKQQESRRQRAIVRQEGGQTVGETFVQRHAKLPATPSPKQKRNDDELTIVNSKKSPSPRPRVPLYNQSPRLSRTPHAYVGVRLQELRRNHHHSRSSAISASEKIKRRYLNGFVQTNRAANAGCYIARDSRTPSPVTVGRSFVLGRKDMHNEIAAVNIGELNDDVSSLDDEVDDDLDNVSDFGSDVSGSSSDEDGYRVYAYKLAVQAERATNQSASRSVSSFMSDASEESLKNPPSLLAPSLFPHVPPYLAFSSNTSKGPEVPADLYRILKWRISNVMPKVVRHILANSGMRLLKKTNDWMGVWGKHLKSPCFRTIRPYQKINHLPGSFKIGRKDSLWKSLQKHSTKHGKKEFGFMPKTYIIPNDLVALRKNWPRYASRNVKWIIKPPASARGAGIRVVSKWAQIPKRRPLIVQRYIERPLLINGSKFDLRLYVLVTSMNPLRVYLYHNGLARFASVKYSDRTDTLHDRCMHLTNYSINKLSSNYAKNEDVNACHGHKWTIKSLWNYLASRGVRTDYLWDALRNLVLRTLLVGESSINHMIRMNVESKYSVYELFGFDILLDADLIPWLLEVNISPSLHSELPLDAHVKAPLVQAVLNTALYNIPPKLSSERQREIATKMSYHAGGSICYDKRLYINYLSRAEKVKHNTFTRKTLEERDEYLSSILENLTPDDVRCLIIAEDELARSAPLERIFPTKDTHKYLKFCDTPRYYNRLLDAWESRYAHNRQAGIGLLTALCLERYHLQVPQAPVKKYSYFEGDDRVFYAQPEEESVAKSARNVQDSNAEAATEGEVAVSGEQEPLATPSDD